MAERTSRVMDLMPLGVLLMFLIYNMHVQSCTAQKTCTVGANTPHPKGVCGTLITELLKLLCGGTYRERSDLVKRSPAAAQSILDMDPKTLLDLTKKAKLNDEVQMGRDAFYDKRDATMFLQKKADYYITGISCECCYNKCDIREMVNYCKEPKVAMRNLRYMSMGL